MTWPAGPLAQPHPWPTRPLTPHPKPKLTPPLLPLGRSPPSPRSSSGSGSGRALQLPQRRHASLALPHHRRLKTSPRPPRLPPQAPLPANPTLPRELPFSSPAHRAARCLARLAPQHARAPRQRLRSLAGAHALYALAQPRTTLTAPRARSPRRSRPSRSPSMPLHGAHVPFPATHAPASPCMPMFRLLPLLARTVRSPWPHRLPAAGLRAMRLALALPCSRKCHRRSCFISAALPPSTAPPRRSGPPT